LKQIGIYAASLNTGEIIVFKNDNNSIAEEYFNKAYILQKRGYIHEAINTYKLSIKFHPTAKAYNCLGRTYGLLGRYEAAIDQCVLATIMEPENGYPYNDIGIYLINLGRFDQAVEWLDKALNAEVYDYRYYALFNLGSVAEIIGHWEEAIIYYSEALNMNSNYKAAQVSLTRVYSYLN